MENTFQEAPWEPSAEAEKTARAALEHVAQDAAIVAQFTAAKAKRDALEAITAELDCPSNAPSPAHQAATDAAERMTAKPTVENALKAFEAFKHFIAARELFGAFSADFLDPLRRAASGDLEAACRATVEAARAKLTADHAARQSAIRTAATAAKIDMSTEARAADHLHGESLRALNDGIYINGPGEFAGRLGLPA